MSALPSKALARGIAVALVTSAALGLAPAALAAPVQDPAQLAAGWLSTQLAGGDHMETTYGGTGYPDAGLTADVVLALDAAGVAQDAAAAATTWLQGQASSYVGDGTSFSYPGGLAKLALVAQAQGLDPASFGGVDLLTRLSARLQPSGRFTDLADYEPDGVNDDYTNQITQALAVLALERAGTAPASAVDFIVGTACPDGGFPLYYGGPGCTSDVDGTAFAVQALLAAGRDVSGAMTWLEGQQGADGGFSGNSNSTGLAATTLRVGGRATAADDGRAFLLGLQVGCSGTLASRGAVAFDDSGYSAGTAPRATAQAVLGLAGVGLATVSGAESTAGFPTLECTAAPAPSPSVEPVDAVVPVTATTGGAGNGGAAAGTAAPALPTTGAPVRGVALLGVLLLLSGTALVVGAGPRRERRAA